MLSAEKHPSRRFIQNPISRREKGSGNGGSAANICGRPGLMGTQIVQDDVHAIHLVQEGDEVGAGVRFTDVGDRGPPRHVEGRRRDRRSGCARSLRWPGRGSSAAPARSALCG